MTSCPEKDALLAEYARLTEKYYEALKQLQRQVATLDRAEQQKLLSVVEKFRSQSEAASLALERHVAEHGC